MIVRALGGLGNRLRVILSRCREGDFQFVWPPDAEICFARFEDVFEPLDGVRITDSSEFGLKPDITTTDPLWRSGSWSKPAWQPLYKQLRPKPEISDRISTLLKHLGPFFDAMHVRRTDCIGQAERDGVYTPDSAFLDFAQSGSGLLYLATDNGQTQRRFQSWIGSRLVVGAPIASDEERMPEGCGRRLTTLADAVVDLYVCTKAKRFMPSGSSSFSQTVVWMRQ